MFKRSRWLTAGCVLGAVGAVYGKDILENRLRKIAANKKAQLVDKKIADTKWVLRKAWQEAKDEYKIKLN
jgi:hypothetical protein